MITGVWGVAIGLAALVVSVWGGAWFTQAVLQRVDRVDRSERNADERTGEEQPGSAQSGTEGAQGIADAGRGVDSPEVRGILRGGRWIGYLERAAVTGSILVGFPAGIAVVVAIKGLGRFPQLRTPVVSERFVIGTLASILWAAAWGWLAVSFWAV